MLGWVKRFFAKATPVPQAAEPTIPAGRATIRLDVTRDYDAPAEEVLGTPEEAKVFRLAHQQGWVAFAAGSYTYIGEDGRANGEMRGRGACERPFASKAESAGFRAGFDAAMKLHFQRVKDAIAQHFAGG